MLLSASKGSPIPEQKRGRQEPKGTGKRRSEQEESGLGEDPASLQATTEKTAALENGRECGGPTPKPRREREKQKKSEIKKWKTISPRG